MWLEANNAALEIFSLSGSDYRGKSDLELAEETDTIYQESFRLCKQTDESAWQLKTASRSDEVIYKPDGTKKIFDVIKVPIFDADGTRKYLTILGRDITKDL